MRTSLVAASFGAAVVLAARRTSRARLVAAQLIYCAFRAGSTSAIT
jgi:hypothetical protein